MLETRALDCSIVVRVRLTWNSPLSSNLDLITEHDLSFLPAQMCASIKWGLAYGFRKASRGSNEKISY